jgi:hypothetical protein
MSNAARENLLVRPPLLARPAGPVRSQPIDPDAALAELSDLLVRGLVSPEEYERQRRKVLGG